MKKKGNKVQYIELVDLSSKEGEKLLKLIIKSTKTCNPRY